MANQRLNIDIVAKDRSRQALNNLQSGLAKVRGAVFNLQSALVGLGAGLVIRNLVNTGKQLESLNVRLKFLFGSAEEGAKAFDNMAKFASRVPFSLEEIQAGSGVLSVVSKDANELAHILEITGNVAAVTGLDFRTTAEQIQRSLSAGISSADLFRERGVKAMLGFSAGATVSVDQTVEAFNRVFGKGGRFGKATDELAKTFEGTLSMIGDKIFNFKKTILEAGFFEGLKAQFGDLDKFLAENEKQLEATAKKIGLGLATAVIKVKDAILFLKDNLDKVMTIFKLLIALPIATTILKIATTVITLTRSVIKLGIAFQFTKRGLLGIATLLVSGGALYGAFKGVDKLFDEMGDKFDELDNKMKQLLPTARDLHKTLIPIREVFKNSSIILHNFEHELSVRIPSATEKAIIKFGVINNEILETMKKKTENIREIIADGINSGITKMSEGFARTLVYGEKLTDTLRTMAQQVLVKIIGFLIEQIARQSLSVFLENTKLGVLIRQTQEMRKQTDEQKKQNKAKGTAMLMSGNPMGFLGFMASGGAVAKGQPYLVGERGPELFVPNETGQITQNARGTSGGSPVTVNFNINTVDASGFDDLLVRSRGTITQLINNAVNERGAKNLI